MTALAAVLLVIAGVLAGVAHAQARAASRDLEECRRILAAARALVGEWQADETAAVNREAGA